MLTRAAHDLINVTTLRIIGWPTRNYNVKGWDGHWVEIEAPKRHDDEFWTFPRARDGVLACASSLLGSPRLLQVDPGGPMLIQLPHDLIEKIRVEIS